MCWWPARPTGSRRGRKSNSPSCCRSTASRARLPTYGVVVRNDAKGLEVRYNAPALRWRDILARLISEDARNAAKPKK